MSSFHEHQMENEWDRLLKIRSSGRDDSNSTVYCYPYEPTPYCVLERLANSGYIRKNNLLLDYGCGKGRVDFFLSYQTRCKSIGIEYDKRIYEIAKRNLDNTAASKRVSVICQNAETYQVPDDADRCYFFNPFSVEILRKVLARIRESYYENPREILFFFYYPSDEYISYLMTIEEMEFMDEIDCRDLFEGNNKRERIMIFKINFFVDYKKI